MRKPAKTLALAGLLLAGPAFARAAEPDVADFLGQRGCVIGPGTLAEAEAEGITAAALEEFAARAVQMPGSRQTGEWLVVAPDLCSITFPLIESELTLDDPEVRASFSAVDAYAQHGDHGCFLDGDKLRSALQDSRGWDAERAFTAYLQLVGTGLQSGELAFHTDDPLRTPVGFALTTGICGEVPGMDVIREDHTLMMRHLDALIRDTATAVPCDEGASLMNMERPDFMTKITDGRYRNAWGWLELMMMAMAADWYEGTSLTRKGQPRPPLCHIAEE
ncbi:hypothetical protein [Paracoccus sp. pheM1]|uniref:hypothetical protein n=1 Tax=Paracoccus sp. pheM1 TaxID=2831675 RepID=UPI001BDB74F8|nr:hypothetical protein [Paracoccus sp. pheM1]MBT0779178.1 hypothetical protein [Paracoccus sp. pheM1]